MTAIIVVSDPSELAGALAALGLHTPAAVVPFPAVVPAPPPTMVAPTVAAAIFPGLDVLASPAPDLEFDLSLDPEDDRPAILTPATAIDRRDSEEVERIRRAS